MHGGGGHPGCRLAPRGKLAASHGLHYDACVLSIKEMRSLASSLPLPSFRKQVGPFALIQRPPGANDAQLGELGLPLNLMTTRALNLEAVSRGTLALLFEFEDLVVATLPPLCDQDELSVGRQPDCDLVIDDPSVSKLHASLKWDEKRKRCTVKDLGSKNGTMLNAGTVVRREMTLADGDILSFGEAQFWFLMTETLHGRLKQGDANLGTLGI